MLSTAVSLFYPQFMERGKITDIRCRSWNVLFGFFVKINLHLAEGMVVSLAMTPGENDIYYLHASK